MSSYSNYMLTPEQIVKYRKGNTSKVMTAQQFFDHAMRTVHRNEICLDWAQKYDEKSGLWSPSNDRMAAVNFNSKGKKKILFALLTDTDFRLLLKHHDYVLLKSHLDWDYIACCAAEKINAFVEEREPGTPCNKPNDRPYSYLAYECYRDFESSLKNAALDMLGKLEDKGFPTWLACSGAMDTLLTLEEDQSDDMVADRNLEYQMSKLCSTGYTICMFSDARRIARDYSLSPDVLKLSP